MRNLYKYLPIAFIMLLGCGGDETARPPGQEYFPVRTGIYQIYAVQQTTYTETQDPLMSVYELKTEVVDSFKNELNTYTYVIHRSIRETESDSWEFQDSWSARVSSHNAILTEGNISYIRISFPPAVQLTWDGNALNALVKDEYVITNTQQSYTFNEVTYPDCIRIEQEDDANFNFRDQREEIYARNVGLIYKKSINVTYCDEAGCFGQGIVKDGIVYEQVLKSYGQN